MATVTLVPRTVYNGSSSYLTITDSNNMLTDTSSTTYGTVQCTRTSTSSYYVYLRNFDWDLVPSDAIVSNITIKVKGYHSGGNTSTLYMYNGTSSSVSACGSGTAFTTSASVITFSNTTIDWDTLKGYGSDLGVRINCRRSNRNNANTIYIYGAEIDVTYTVPVYHNVTVTNSTTATVSANPTTVLEGSSSVVTADTVSGITVTDNGTDVTSQFVQHSGTSGDYSIETRGSYGFTLNSNDYYQSTNKGIDKSCAVCRISFSLPVSATITFQYINYAEATYDFGVFGNVDVALTTNYYPAGSGGATISETSYKKACNTSSDNTSSVQTLTYSNVSAGDHFIDVKFSKDDGTASNNDTLQFKVSITYSQSVTYYTYTINNITTDHAIVVTSGGSTPTLYVKQNGSWVEVAAAYKKVNGSWVQQSDVTTVFASGTNYKQG